MLWYISAHFPARSSHHVFLHPTNFVQNLILRIVIPAGRYQLSIPKKWNQVPVKPFSTGLSPHLTWICYRSLNKNTISQGKNSFRKAKTMNWRPFVRKNSVVSTAHGIQPLHKPPRPSPLLHFGDPTLSLRQGLQIHRILIGGPWRPATREHSAFENRQK